MRDFVRVVWLVGQQNHDFAVWNAPQRPAKIWRALKNIVDAGKPYSCSIMLNGNRFVAQGLNARRLQSASYVFGSGDSIVVTQNSNGLDLWPQFLKEERTRYRLGACPRSVTRMVPPEPGQHNIVSHQYHQVRPEGIH